MCVPPLVFITKWFSGSSICCPHCVLNQGAVLGFFNHSLAGATCLPCWPQIGLSLLSEATLKLSHKVLNKPLGPPPYTIPVSLLLFYAFSLSHKQTLKSWFSAESTHMLLTDKCWLYMISWCERVCTQFALLIAGDPINMALSSYRAYLIACCLFVSYCDTRMALHMSLFPLLFN